MLERVARFRELLVRIEQALMVSDLPLRGDYKHTKVLLGTLLAQMNLARHDVQSLTDAEFQVFSQFGDDGIIQYLVHRFCIQEHTFIEFGVQDYTESNTRFLLVKDKWSGLVMDGNRDHIDYIRRDPISTYFNVRPAHAFITAENINALVESGGMSGRIGLLGIDIDGMDYWVWRALSVVNPAIVVIEYNASFGQERAVTVPYTADFVRWVAHPSGLYYGASLTALQLLAHEKGYRFIGCNANGNNAYFVRAEFAELPWVAALKKKFSEASFAECAIDGRRVRGHELRKTIRGLPVVDVRTGNMEPLEWS